MQFVHVCIWRIRLSSSCKHALEPREATYPCVVIPPCIQNIRKLQKRLQTGGGKHMWNFWKKAFLTAERGLNRSSAVSFYHVFMQDSVETVLYVVAWICSSVNKWEPGASSVLVTYSCGRGSGSTERQMMPEWWQDDFSCYAGFQLHFWLVFSAPGVMWDYLWTIYK